MTTLHLQWKMYTKRSYTDVHLRDLATLQKHHISVSAAGISGYMVNPEDPRWCENGNWFFFWQSQKHGIWIDPVHTSGTLQITAQVMKRHPRCLIVTVYRESMSMNGELTVSLKVHNQAFTGC